MSSDDSGFDKEAEREKLREKYEQDKKDRENTQRMSELLLQGATMTGKHCNECGDPIFRYDGQEFCPTCQREVDGGRGEAADAGKNETESADDDRGEPTDPTTQTEAANRTTDEPEGASTDEPRVEIDGVRVADRHADRSNLRDPPSQRGRNHDHSGRSASGSKAGTADLSPARESLVRTLTDLARRAEETDDVARARDLLAATREAAEALAALDRANR
ncbi:Sjogren's syndrome/scleroderma autoantigen 1 family protein [Halorussus amylolyticus]|uniref:Sjogren's syndrome/scleroderma autoantigen 1 family protein n=1 Tax=Halorussus amylolyticus TaxID=1126242 RepID=UPI0010435D6B|nr:Sjogren's syndrome/scleroderma autoantigen 1 family protein [Halorussus amylolyticus]